MKYIAWILCHFNRFYIRPFKDTNKKRTLKIHIYENIFP